MSRRYDYEHPPVHVSKGGVSYVRPDELVQSRVFWERVELSAAMMRKRRATDNGRER